MTFESARRLALAAALALAGCSVPIAGALEEGDANRIVVALDAQGIGSDKEADPANEGRYRVSVSREDAAAAAQVLNDQNLPPPAAPGVLDALGQGSLVPSRASEQAKLVAGTAGELERSLRGVDGVVAARVHLAVPSPVPFSAEMKEPGASASVLIRHRGGTPPLAPKEVQSLVAGAVAGLSSERVSVVMLPSASADRPAARELSHLGPITVTRGSVGTLRLAVSAVVLTNLVLIGLLLLLWVRVRRTQSALDEARAAGQAR